MSRLRSLDNFWIGLLAGIVFPMMLFFLYWLFFHNQLGFPGRFISYLRNGLLLSNVIKVCGLGNLIIFYIGLNRKLDRFSKGVVLSVFLYIGLIAYVTYYLESQEVL
jgi:hypothetical protein